MKKSVNFISVGCFLLAFGTFSAHSDEKCERQFVVKPKKVKRLSPKEISSLSNETLHSLQPKHLFLKQGGKQTVTPHSQPGAVYASKTETSEVEGQWGDLRVTVAQFQALDLNSLHPKTFELIVSRRDVLALLSDTQVQELSLNDLSPDIVRSLMSSSLAADLKQKFQELDLSQWPEEDLKPFIEDPSLAQHMGKKQIEAVKQRTFLSPEELKEQQEALSLQKKKSDMEAIEDHGIFNQAIANGSFDKKLTPFLRISELNDKAFIEVFYNTIHEVAMRSDDHKELSKHIFDHLSDQNVLELLKRTENNGGLNGVYWSSIIPYIRDHSVFNEAIDNIFGSAKTDEELFSTDIGRALEKLRFAELNDSVIDKIRRALFLHPEINHTKTKENIAELIRRPGGLDAAAVSYKNRSDEKESPVFTVLFEENRLTEEILKYALLERPDFLNSFKSMSQVPKDVLIDIVFGDKSSELSEETFSTALQTGLRIERTTYGSRISLSVDQIESLIRNPYIISPEKFDEIKNTEEYSRSKKSYYHHATYGQSEERNMPEDFRNEHFVLLKSSLRSLLEIDKDSGLHIQVIGTNSEF